MPRIFEPYDLRLGVFGYHLFGNLCHYITIFATEDKEYRFVQVVEHIALSLALNHTIQKRNDARIFGEINGLL